MKSLIQNISIYSRHQFKNVVFPVQYALNLIFRQINNLKSNMEEMDVSNQILASY